MAAYVSIARTTAATTIGTPDREQRPLAHAAEELKRERGEHRRREQRDEQRE